jgi:hypothetical protein
VAAAAAGAQTMAVSDFACGLAEVRRGEEEGGPANGPPGCRAAEAEAEGGVRAAPRSWGPGRRPLTRQH